MRSGLRDPRYPPWEDRTQPLVPALAGKGQPDPSTPPAEIPEDQLPHDAQGRLLRPGVVWFGEALPVEALEAAEEATEACNLFITVCCVCCSIRCLRQVCWLSDVWAWCVTCL